MPGTQDFHERDMAEALVFAQLIESSGFFNPDNPEHRRIMAETGALAAQVIRAEEDKPPDLEKFIEVGGKLVEKLMNPKDM